jgi:hypothetical protein
MSLPTQIITFEMKLKSVKPLSQDSLADLSIVLKRWELEVSSLKQQHGEPSLLEELAKNVVLTLVRDTI